MMISSTTSMILLCTINVLLLHNAVNTNEVTDKDQSDEIEYSELDPETSIASKSFHLMTRVFNAFPKPDVSAFVLFEHDRISRLHYGQLSVINATLEPHSDFIIQFREMPTDSKYIHHQFRTTLIWNYQQSYDFILLFFLFFFCVCQILIISCCSIILMTLHYTLSYI